jgi:PEP-CTERM motif
MAAGCSARLLMVKPAVAIAVLAVSFSGMARANSITFENSGGSAGATVTGGDPGSFTLSDSTITSASGINLNGNKTLLSFTTGAWITGSGSLATGGQWSSGGTVTITEAGLGIIFKGTFSGNVTWTLDSSASCSICQYSLSGGITGTYWANGESAGGPGTTIDSASTVQLVITTTGGLYGGGKGTKFLSDKGGTTNLNTPTGLTAEPGSLLLMGTGLLGAGFLARKKSRGDVV